MEPQPQGACAGAWNGGEAFPEASTHPRVCVHARIVSLTLSFSLTRTRAHARAKEPRVGVLARAHRRGGGVARLRRGRVGDRLGSRRGREGAAREGLASLKVRRRCAHKHTRARALPQKLFAVARARDHCNRHKCTIPSPSGTHHASHHVTKNYSTLRACVRALHACPCKRLLRHAHAVGLELLP